MPGAVAACGEPCTALMLLVLRSTAGEAAPPEGTRVAAPASRRAAATSRRATCWLPPPSGTSEGTPEPRRAARHSASTQTAKWAQASHRAQARTCRTVPAVTWAVSQSRDGRVSGRGLPTESASASGTPTSTTSSPRTASTPERTSRRRSVRAGGLLGSRETVAVRLLLLVDGGIGFL